MIPPSPCRIHAWSTRWLLVGVQACLLAMPPCAKGARALHAGGFLASGDSLVVSFTVSPGEAVDGLAWDARMESKSWSGSAPVLRARLDGRALGGDRLANKEMTFHMANGRLLAWANGDLWRVVYSPDFDLARNTGAGAHVIAGAPPFTLALRAGDLLPAGPHRLVLQHAAPKLPRVEIRNVELVSLPPAAAGAGKPSAGSSSLIAGDERPRSDQRFMATPGTTPAPTEIVLASGGGVHARWNA